LGNSGGWRCGAVTNGVGVGGGAALPSIPLAFPGGIADGLACVAAKVAANSRKAADRILTLRLSICFLHARNFLGARKRLTLYTNGLNTGFFSLKTRITVPYLESVATDVYASLSNASWLNPVPIFTVCDVQY
jgi:hypothetical protein